VGSYFPSDNDESNKIIGAGPPLAADSAYSGDEMFTCSYIFSGKSMGIFSPTESVRHVAEATHVGADLGDQGSDGDRFDARDDLRDGHDLFDRGEASAMAMYRWSIADRGRRCALGSGR